MKVSTLSKTSEIKVSYKPKLMEGPKITSSLSAYEQLKAFYPKDTISLQEHFVILYLNRANNIIGGYHAFTGGITGTIADIRIIMGVALKSMACGMIISHNHPSGTLKPSAADKELTQRINEAGRMLNITLLDHIIVSPYEGSFYSFADEGLI